MARKSTKKKEQAVDPLNNDDLWVRGKVYVRFKHLLDDADIEVSRMKDEVARARYEHDITQRVLAKAESPEAREEWEIRASVARDWVAMQEQNLEEAVQNAACYRAMVAELEADLGDKAQEYEELLDMYDLDEDWDEEDLDEFERFALLSSLDDEEGEDED